jgi:hypothetical protein
VEKRNWREFSFAEKMAIILTGMLQVTLLAAALIDLLRRPAVAVRGSKWMWLPLVFINFFGPICYFIIGRKRLPVA